jgi:hypothetical protein
MKAKPNANTRTLRPDKCLVVSSLSPGLRPGYPRNTGDNAATTRTDFRQPARSPLRRSSCISWGSERFAPIIGKWDDMVANSRRRKISIDGTGVRGLNWHVQFDKQMLRR